MLLLFVIMISLFKKEGYDIVISDEAFTLKPFRLIWNRDRSKGKEKAIAELGFIYHFSDARSDYNKQLVDPKEREEAIKEGEGLPKEWKPDKLVQEAIKFYESFKPMSALLLEDTRIAVDKLRRLLRDIDLSEVDDKGKPKYTLNTITATIKQVPELAKSLREAEDALTQEIREMGRIKGQKEKALMEDSLDI